MTLQQVIATLGRMEDTANAIASTCGEAAAILEESADEFVDDAGFHQTAADDAVLNIREAHRMSEELLQMAIELIGSID